MFLAAQEWAGLEHRCELDQHYQTCTGTGLVYADLGRLVKEVGVGDGRGKEVVWGRGKAWEDGPGGRRGMGPAWATKARSKP